MGKQAAKKSERARKLYVEADQILGYPLSRFCFEGPEETLTRTLYAQPGIFTTSLALCAILEDEFLSRFRSGTAMRRNRRGQKREHCRNRGLSRRAHSSRCRIEDFARQGSTGSRG